MLNNSELLAVIAPDDEALICANRDKKILGQPPHAIYSFIVTLKCKQNFRILLVVVVLIKDAH